jgi:MFS family permease
VGSLLVSARELPRNAWLLLCSTLLASMPIGLLMVFFPLYLHDLGLHAFLIGGVFTAAGLGASVLMLSIGPLADRVGRRYFLIGGTALPMLGYAIFFSTSATGWLVAASMLGGVGFSGGMGGALVTTTLNPMLAGTVGPRQRTAVMSWLEAFWVLSLAGGALLAGLPALLARSRLLPLLEADRLMFLLCFAATLGATLLLLPVREQAGAEPHQPVRRRAGRADIRSAAPMIGRLSVFFGLQGVGLGLVVQLLPLWFELRYHTTAIAIAPLFSISQLGGLLTIPLVPALVRRLGMGRFILLVSAASTALLAGIPLSPVVPLAGAFYITRNAIVSMQWPAQGSFLQGAVAPLVRGTATSVTLGCWSLANAFAPSLAGYLLDRRLLMLPLLLGLACYAASAGWFWLALRRTPMPEEAVEVGMDPDVAAVGAGAAR